MTTVHFSCANCGAPGQVSTSEAQEAPTGWYRIAHGILGAYCCSFACVVALGPTLNNRGGHARPVEVTR